jgi:hypothetical protein
VCVCVCFNVTFMTAAPQCYDSYMCSAAGVRHIFPVQVQLLPSLNLAASAIVMGDLNPLLLNVEQ